jgi:hypothetical protein
MKKIITALSIIILALTTKVNAINVIDADETMVQTGEYNSTRIIAGNTVTNKAKVDGLSIIAGNEVNLEGSAPYGFFAGNNVTVNEEIEKDLFIAGNNITIGEQAKIGRDIFLAGNIIKIKSNINRDLKVGASSVDLSGVTIKGDAYIAAEQIILDNETVIEGKLTYPKEAKIEGLNKASIKNTEVIEPVEVNIEYNTMDRVYGFIASTIASFLTLTILFYVLPSAKEKLDNTELTADSIIKKSLIGLISLIVTPIIIIIGLCTVILAPASLITLAIYAISIYLSNLLVYYIVGKEVTKKLNKENKYLSIIIGIVSVKLIKYIPVIGGLISILSLFYGLGLVFKFIQNKSN